MSVAAGGLHVEDAGGNFEDGNIEGAAAQVVNGDHFARGLVEAVGERGRGWLVQDALHVEAGDAPGVFGGFALRVVEIGGNGDDRLGDRFAQIGLGDFAHAGQDQRRDLRRRHGAFASFDPSVAVLVLDDAVGDRARLALDHVRVELLPHQAFDGIDRVLGVGRALALGHLPDEPFALGGERDDGRRGARALGIGNHLDLRLTGGVGAFDHRHAGVGGT